MKGLVNWWHGFVFDRNWRQPSQPTAFDHRRKSMLDPAQIVAGMGREAGEWFESIEHAVRFIRLAGGSAKVVPDGWKYEIKDDGTVDLRKEGAQVLDLAAAG